MEKLIVFDQELQSDIKTLFNWTTNKYTLERLISPFSKIKIELIESLGSNSMIKLKKRYTLEIKVIEFIPTERYVCIQIKGPFKKFKYSCFFFDQKKSTILEGRIHFEFPFFLKFLTFPFQKQVERLLHDQKQVLKNDLKQLSIKTKSLKIALSGSHGLIGSALSLFLKSQGHEIIPISRKKGEGIYYNIEKQIIEIEKMESLDAIIHLGGYPVVGMATKKHLKKVKDSRIKSTQLLADAIGQLTHPPKTFICASASGFYGNQENVVDESNDAGVDFFATLCKEVEEKATQVKGRVVCLRIGSVLAFQGGLLKRMLLLFKWGLGAQIGNGHSFLNWIALDDLLYGIHFILHHKHIKGAVNMVSPEGLTHKNFAKILAKVLDRPAFLRIPAFVLRLIFKEFATSVLLCHTKIVPKKLLDYRFEFCYANLTHALEHILGR